MSSTEFGSHSNAILVVGGRGIVLARSGPPDVVAHFDHDPLPGVPPIASPLEDETRARLMTLLSRATNRGGGGPPLSLEARLGNDSVHLTLHPLGDDPVGVVVTRRHERVAPNLDATRGVVERTWAHLTDGAGLPAMLRNLLVMAGDLGWRLSATGIETSAQWEEIREAGFESGQGFALFEPMSATDTVALLRQSV